MDLKLFNFTGPLFADFHQFVAYMQVTDGHNLTLFEIINRFDKFLLNTYPNINILSKDILARWFDSFSHLKLSTQKRYRSATFKLCYFLHRNDSTIPLKLNFPSLRGQTKFTPYIYSEDDVIKILTAANKLKNTRKNPIRAKSYELIIILLYTSGLRIGEAVRCKNNDYNTENGTLTIRKTKFSKSRIVPLSKSTQSKINQYINHRSDLKLKCLPEDSLIWSPRISGPSKFTVSDVLYQLLCSCRLKSEKGKGKKGDARIHDFRFTFAVHRVLKWYKDGVDVTALLPYLSVYMGHVGLESTQYYLTFIHEILNEASKLFEKHSVRNTKEAR